MRKKSLLIIVPIVVLLVAAIVLCVFYYLSNNYVATVGGEKITTAEYKYYLYNIKNQMEQSGGVSQDDKNAQNAFWTNKIGNEKAEDVLKSRALDRVWAFKIQLLKAKQANTTVDKKMISDVNSRIDEYVKSLGSGMVGKQKFKEENGLDVGSMKAVVKEEMTVLQFAENEQKKIKITDEELKKRYNDSKDSYDYVTVKHLLFSIVDKDQKPLPEDKKKEAKKKAEDMLARVKAGEDMEKLVLQYSEDPSAKDNKGEFTFDNTGLAKDAQSSNDAVVKEFPDWAFKHKVGEFGIVETTYGYHVVKLVSRTGYDEKAKEKVKSEIIQDRYTKLLDGWKKEKQYEIKKNDKVYNSISVTK